MSVFKKKKNELIVKKRVNNITGETESNLIRKENLKFWSRIGIAVSLIMIVFIICAVVSIYKNLSEINLWLGISITALVIVLLIIFVVSPVIKIFNSPSFTLDSTALTTSIKAKNYRTMKSVANNLINSENSIPFEQKKKIEEAMPNRYKLRDELNIAYDKYIKKDISKIIWLTSSKVACATGISSNNIFDAMSIIILDIRMIMQIVVKCGYRPSYTKLSKLIFKVFRNALIAYTIQTTNIIEKFARWGLKTLGMTPGISTIAAPFIEAATNGLFTARVGIIARKYLYSEFKIHSKILSLEEAENIIAEESAIEAQEILKENGVEDA